MKRQQHTDYPNRGSWKLLTLGLAFATSAAYAQFNPVPLTSDSYNADVVVERTGPRPVIPGGQPGAPTTASMDGGIANTGNTWNEQGYFLSDPLVGLPPAGSTISTNNHQYTFAPSYTASNAIMLNASYFTNTNFRLSNPAAYGALSFLTSGGNGGAVFRYTVDRQDGTSDTGTTASPDWFNVANNIGWVANGRVHAQNFTLENYNSGNPRLYMVDVALAASSSPITNINIQFVSGNATGNSAILAISGAPGIAGPFTPILGTGYNADIVVEATAPRRWNLDGITPPTSFTMDNGPLNTGNTWFEQGYYAPSNSFGLPPAGTVLTTNSHSFQLPASYTAENAIFINPNDIPTARATLATPTPLSGLSILTAAGNGPAQIEAVVHFQNGTTETTPLSLPDWFNVSSGIAAITRGRIDVTSGVFQNLNQSNPRLYYVDWALTNTASPVTSIDFNYLGTGGRAVILAVSGTTGAVAPAITLQPTAVKTNLGATVSFGVAASGTQPLTFTWQRGVNGVFSNLANTGNVSGANTATVQLNNVSNTDLADYRVIVANAAGSATSAVATLTVLSSLTDVTRPGDAVTAIGGNTPAAEGPANAINDDTTKYLNFGLPPGDQAAPFVGPAGLVVTPSVGRTVVSGLRLWTANDDANRDPADYTLEGSNDGTTFTVISSGALSLPAGRNAAGQPLDPLAQNIQQVLFPNTTGYSMYRLTFNNVKNNAAANSMQIGEIELLGVVDTSGFPAVTTQPVDVRTYFGSNVVFQVAVSGTPAPTIQWQREINGTFTDIAGATGTALTLNNAATLDATRYRAVVSNSAGTVNSRAATLRLISPLETVLQPTDVIVSFGDQSGSFWGDNTNTYYAVDLTTAKWQSGGSGFSAPAGFPPFQGPVGLVLTPATPTVVSGLRIYTANDAPERDPADYLLEGSVDGANYMVISSGSLDLPLERNPDDETSVVDPLTSAFQEILLDNNRAFTSYRLTFNNTRNNNTANSLQVGEIQFLGTTASAVSPFLTIERSGDNIVITSSTPGTLESTPSLSESNTVWTSEGAISGSRTFPATQDSRFYRLRVP